MKAPHTLLKALAILALSVPYAAYTAPANLVQAVTYDSETITLRLALEPLRGANFELWSQNATGGYDAITPVDERSYLGTVDEYPGAVSCGILQDDGTFRGAVYFDRGATWFSLGTTVVETRALDYGTFSNFQIPGAPTVGPGQAGSIIWGYELGLDADHDYYTSAGSSVVKAFETIEYSVCVVRAIYMRDVLLRPHLGRVIIRSALAHDPYTGLSQGNYLDALRLEWNTNHTDTDPDLVAGVSPTKIGGGLAWVGVVGTTSGYSVNQSGVSGQFDVVFRHEMGHNWGCSHFVGGSPEGAGLMGGNAPGRFSGCEAHVAFNHRDNRIAAGGILDNEGAYTAIELPPYASMDTGEFVQTVDSSVSFDVLANDHDANAQTVSLLSHDNVSAQGGAVIQQGQNLVYTAPGAYLGTDYFFYTATDTTGKTATGVVIVDVQPNDDLRLYLALDETSGTTASDQSVFVNPCALSGTDFATASTAGTFGNAVDLDGIDDHLTVSGLAVDSDTVTITAWVRQGATQNAWAGIVFDRSGPAAGLNIGTSTELRYHWNGANWGWDSGLTPPANVWTFVALVIEPSQATIYMNSGGGFQSAVNATSHSPASFGTTYVGWDPNSSARHFDGAIDDVHVYNRSLSPAELQSLVDGGSAESPNPFDGATDVSSALMSWAPGATATSYDVYLGTSESAVSNATQASPEYQGSTASPQFLASLSDLTQYFWRVDTVTPSTTLSGPTWSFTTGTLPAPGDTILVNFGQGGGENFSGGQLIGPTSADSSNWNEVTGATGSLAGLIDNAGAATGADIQWFSANTWSNNDGTADDEHRMTVGYLDDGDGSNGDGKGVLVTVNNIPYASYRIYGLFASDQNQGTGGSCGIVNFDVNGTWALGGDASTTAAVWGTIEANNSNNGSFWTQIVPGSVQGNYWVVETAGSTCTLTGELRSGSNRGSLTAVIVEEIAPPGNNPPVWNTNPLTEINATEDSPYSATLADDASDPESDPMTFSKVSGPAWLSVAADGTLSGTPGNGDVGLNVFTVQVAATGGSDGATLNITVDNVNDPPVFTVNPINEADATQDVAYTGSIAGSATDPDAGDTLTYSKISGPAWLTVASGGSLSGTPGSADLGVNQWTVRVTDGGGLTDDSTLQITVNGAPTGEVTYNAIAETTTTGTASGGFGATTTSDNGYETLTEEVTGGNPTKRRSQLQHEWTFSITGGIAATLSVEAYHTANSEGDDFIFSYSIDGSVYTDVLTVSKTADDDLEQTAALPSNLDGTVYIRVVDADNTQGNSIADSLFVDLLAIDVTPSTGPPAAAANPSPANGATGTSLTPALTWDAAGGADSYDVFFGATAPGTFQGNQTLTSFSPGTLSASTIYFWRIDSVNGNGTTTGTAWSFTTGAGGSSTLFSDDFEDGDVNGWSTTGNVSANTSAANGGVYGAKLRAAASMTVTIDTTAVGGVDLAYDRSTSNYDGGEALTVEWSSNGTTWNLVESTSATNWGTTTVTLPAGAAGQPALQIRISTNASQNNENGYLDNVLVSGY